MSPRCVVCCQRVKHLVRTEQGSSVVERCPACETQCDPYVEVVGVQVCLDIFLLRPQAWIHVVHNMQRAWRVLLPLLCFAVLSETYVATVFDVYAGVLRGYAPVEPLPAETRPTLKLVDNLRSPRVELMRFGSVPESCLYGCLEFVFVALSLTWAASWLTDAQHDAIPDVLKTWFSATAAVWSLKGIFAVFMVWSVPLYLVVIVDLLSVLWLLRAVQAVAPFAKTTSCVLVAVIAIGMRFAFRGVTRWCPLFLTADLLMPALA